MAIQVGLSFYRLELNRKHARTSPWTMSFGSDTDGFAEVLKYLEDRKKHLIPYDENEVLHVEELHSNQGGLWIDGILKRGSAGSVQDIINIETARVTHTKTKQEAVLEPYYFRFQMEDGRPFGILILQTWGHLGTKGAILTDLKTYLSERPEPLMPKLIQVIDETMLDRFAAEGKLQDVVLVNRGATPESRAVLSRNSVSGQSLGEPGDKLEVRLSKRGGWTQSVLRKVKSVISDKQRARALIQTDGMEEVDELKITLRVGKHDQTFDLLNPDDSPFRLDITEQLAYGPGGYPTLASLRAAAISVYKESILPLLG